MLVHELIRNTTALRPDALALKYRETSLNYGELDQQIERVAQSFCELGLKRGDRVGIYLDKCIEAVIAKFAATSAGGVFVPLNPVLKAPQAKYILNNCNIPVLVTSKSRLDALAEVIDDCVDLKTIILIDEQAEAGEFKGRKILPWSHLISEADAQHPVHRVIDSDTAAILFTSGSTGMPKGVVLSHRNLVSSALSASEHLQNDHSDRILCVLPFSFDYGLVQLTSAFSKGASVVLLNYLFPGDVIKALPKEGITGLAGVPPLWIQLSQARWPEGAAQSLRYITNSGGAMPKATLRKLRNHLPGTKINLMYGLTEAFRSTSLPDHEVDARPESVGKAIPNADVMVVRENGEPCEPREMGELVHRGVFVSKGYWKNPDATAERFKPSPEQQSELSLTETAVWSGDLAWYDEEGFLYFVGRRDDQIKTSGYRVGPVEVEDIVYATDLVGEVAAFGIPHPLKGQAVGIVVTPPAGGKIDIDAITSQCRKEMPAYMVPDLIIEKPGIPRTPNGKMDRKVFAQEFADHFKDIQL